MDNVQEETDPFAFAAGTANKDTDSVGIDEYVCHYKYIKNDYINSIPITDKPNDPKSKWKFYGKRALKFDRRKKAKAEAAALHAGQDWKQKAENR